MTAAGSREKPRILVAGAGVAGLAFVSRLGELAPEAAEVEVVAPEHSYTYSPWAAGEAFGVAPSRRLDIGRVLARSGATLRRGRVVAVDPGRRIAFTSTGQQLGYDLLVVACGARPAAALAAHVTFRGTAEVPAMRALLEEVERHLVRRVVFVVPGGSTWPLPLYELALLTAARLELVGRRRCSLSLVTPEPTPLALFGERASAAVAALLDASGVDVHCGRRPDRIVGGRLLLVPNGELPVERIVALPRLHGPGLVGVPSDPSGFVPVDPGGRVTGIPDVYGVGDVTTFPVKLGGIAVQQAEAVAGTVAARLSGQDASGRFRPLLRGLLLTGEGARFLWADPIGGRGDTSMSAAYPLWWPPEKIAGWTVRDTSDPPAREREEATPQTTRSVERSGVR